jgi:hypothetical protein
MKTVTNVLQQVSGPGDNTSPGGWCCDLRCYRVTTPAAGRPQTARLDEEDPWPAATTNTATTSAATRTARGSRAGSTKRATSAATAKDSLPGTRRARLTGSPKGMPRALLLPIVLAAGHPHLRPAQLALAVTAAVVVYVLAAVALPTRKCPRCDGDRIQFTRHWLTGKAAPAPASAAPALAVSPAGCPHHSRAHLVSQAREEHQAMTAGIITIDITIAAAFAWIRVRGAGNPPAARQGRSLVHARPKPGGKRRRVNGCAMPNVWV